MIQEGFDWLSKRALYHPHKIALTEEGKARECSYLELNNRAESLHSFFFEKCGVRQGDRIAVLADFCIDYIVLFAAAQKGGWILVPLNYRMTGPEVDPILEDVEPMLVIVEEKYTNLLPKNLRFPFLSMEALEELGQEDGRTPHAHIQEEDPIFLLYTSGSTGRPKGVIYTHKMLFWNSVNTALSLHLSEESRTVNVMPPFHTGGWNVLLTPFLHRGGRIHLMPKFDPQQVLERLVKEKSTLFMGVPTMLKMMADQSLFEALEFPDLQYIVVGGESMPLPLIEQYGSKGVAIRQGYGMTEVGPNLTSLHQADALRKKGSIGRPNFYVSCKIVNQEGITLPPGEPGELWLSGPVVTPGYWRSREASRSAFGPDGQWFKSGDRALVDEEGYYYIVDRIKNMFISGGENVYPAEVERVLRQYPGLCEVAVVGVKDEHWGEVGCAFMVMESGQEGKEEKIKEFCKKRLAGYKVPKKFVYLDNLPKTPSGKIDKKTLLTFLP
jgi:fatty-acyl-CoA synthase